MSSPAANSSKLSPRGRFDRAFAALDGYVHAAEGAMPHDPSERIGLSYPHCSGGSLTFEVEFRRDAAAGVYRPRTSFELLSEMTVGSHVVDMVNGAEVITQVSDTEAVFDVNPERPDDFALMTMAFRMEAALRKMRLGQDAVWWVEQGADIWTGDDFSA